MSWQLSNGKEGGASSCGEINTARRCVLGVARAERVGEGDAIKNQRDYP